MATRKNRMQLLVEQKNLARPRRKPPRQNCGSTALEGQKSPPLNQREVEKLRKAAKKRAKEEKRQLSGRSRSKEGKGGPRKVSPRGERKRQAKPGGGKIYGRGNVFRGRYWKKKLGGRMQQPTTRNAEKEHPKSDTQLPLSPRQK